MPFVCSVSLFNSQTLYNIILPRFGVLLYPLPVWSLFPGTLPIYHMSHFYSRCYYGQYDKIPTIIVSKIRYKFEGTTTEEEMQFKTILTKFFQQNTFF